ncbi:hypothetical protein ABZZ80_02520 [Streptomyces sp. NPDC006356]
MSDKTNKTKKQNIDLPGFQRFATLTAEQLGDGWTLDPDNTEGPLAYLTHPSGRSIGIRYLWRGQAVQTWAVGVPPREYENEDDAKVMAANGTHLTPGDRYNVAVTFTHNPPVATTARNIRTRLLPAYDGKRPLLRAFPRKRTRSAANRRPAATKAPEPQKKSPSRSRTSTAASTSATTKGRKPRAAKAQPASATQAK